VEIIMLIGGCCRLGRPTKLQHNFIDAQNVDIPGVTIPRFKSFVVTQLVVRIYLPRLMPKPYYQTGPSKDYRG
jgi:hypothetical protein